MNISIIKEKVIKKNSDFLYKIIGERGTSKKGLESTIIATIVCVLGAIFLFNFGNIFDNAEISQVNYYKYLAIVLIIYNFVLLGIYIYKKEKNKDNSILVKQLFILISIIVLFVLTLPILVLISPLLLIEIIFKIKGIVRTFLNFLIKISFYMLAYIVIIMISAKIAAISFLIYIIMIVAFSVGLYFMHYFTEIKLSIGNYYEAYNMKRFYKSIYNFLLGISALILSVYSLKTTNEDYLYLLIPIITFVGCEQVFNNGIIRINKSKDIFQDLYNELLILRDVSITGIDYSKHMRIRIKLSYNIYDIVSYQKYIIDNYRCWPKKRKEINEKKINKTMDYMKLLLSKEYNIYEMNDKEVLCKDINDTIESIAECLVTL